MQRGGGALKTSLVKNALERGHVLGEDLEHFVLFAGTQKLDDLPVLLHGLFRASRLRDGTQTAAVEPVFIISHNLLHRGIVVMAIDKEVEFGVVIQIGGIVSFGEHFLLFIDHLIEILRMTMP